MSYTAEPKQQDTNIKVPLVRWKGLEPPAY